MKMKKALSMVMAICMLAALTGCARSNGGSGGTTAAASTAASSGAASTAAAGSYTIRVACENSESFPSTLGLAQMKKYIEAKTNGAVEVDIYANGQLGGEEDTLDQVSQGTLEMAVASFAPVVSYDKDFEVMDIPFVYSSYEQAWMVLDSYVGTDLMDTLESAGMKGMAYMENGFRQCTTNVAPIQTMADFKGLKIRTMQNNNHMASFSAMGANPTPVPFSELYMSLSQKVVDAQENPIANVTDKKLNEVQKYLSLTKHIYDAMPLVCNLAYFNSLPAEYQGIVQNGAIYGMEYSRFCNEERESLILDYLAKEGMQINEVTEDARTEMANTAQPAVEKLVATDIGQDKVDQYLSDVKTVLGDISNY